MADFCTDAIYSEEYVDYLVEYVRGGPSSINEVYDVSCSQIASDRFAVIYQEGGKYTSDELAGIKLLPRCYGLLSSEEVLTSSGVTRVRRQPGLDLYGTGVIIGFVDTGIDYSHPAFIGSDGRTRILSIWDQTKENLSEGEKRPEDFFYGVEYTQEDIDHALESDDPLGVVPSRDRNGHGTFLAGIACGGQIEEESFSGVAPLAQICVVKCKEAKQNLRDYYFIGNDVPCYAETDIMLGIRYLWLQAVKRRTPLIICLGMGTSQGSHDRGGILGQFLQEYGDYRGVFCVTAGGNEGNAAHHYRSPMIEIDGEIEVELKVGAKENGFSMELWTDSPDLYAVALISPDGEYSGRTEARLGESRRIPFLFTNTVVYIDYLIVSAESGDECIRIRFENPLEGIWKIRVFNANNYSGFFDLWLPIRNFITDETYFLRPDPDITICDPSNNIGVITCSYYNSLNRSEAIESGRGYTRTQNIKPNFAAPGNAVYGTLPFAGNYPANEEERTDRARFGYRSGSSYAAAVTAGCVALLAQWALIERNDIGMDTNAANKYLIRGAQRQGMLNVPNRTWGNGTLDIYGVFDSLRPR